MRRSKWDKEKSIQFINHGKDFTPMRDYQYDIICDLISQPGLKGTVHELCCGAGDLAKAVLDTTPGIELEAWDGSPTMLEQTRATCERHAARLTTRLFDLAEASWRRPQGGAAAVYSSLAIHHLDGEEKRRLFKDVHAMLRDGGWLVIADLMAPLNETGFSASAWQWEREVARNSQTLYRDDRAEKAFREMEWNVYRHPGDNPDDTPSSVFEHLRWLNDAGFKDVDVHWMVAGHAIVSGVKP